VISAQAARRSQYAPGTMEPWLEPLYDARGMRGADSWAINDRGVPSLELMEAAGEAVATAVRETAAPGPVRIVCGKGNNAGDGLVAARLLTQTGFDVETLLLWPAAELSGDAGVNLGRLDGAVREPGGAIGAVLEESGAIVDAIFGTGFSGAPRAPADAAIAAINACPAPVIAADIASGVDASSGEVADAAVEADVTVSFHAAKLGHWISPGKAYTGDLRVSPIGIPDGARAEPAGGLIGPGVLELAPRRRPGSTKFTSGQALIVGGSRGLTGAVCMAGEAAIRAGAGYATVAVPADLEPIFEVKLTEVMSRGFDGATGRLATSDRAAIADSAARAASVVLGPGLGRDPDSLELARALAGELEAPLLIDADGLNAHAGRLHALADRSAPTVLTPHEGELGRLLERESAEVAAHRLASARDAAEQSGAIVVLKGDDTLVAGGGRLAISRGGAPGLATAGTGDVLSGVIGAFLARGMAPFDAACAGVFAQRRAGALAAERLGAAESVIATEVIASLPEALA
jgi:ADP-dependent NAD(P)H-hydrate dehydratase / NAD(P)H-hydrate epimerase